MGMKREAVQEERQRTKERDQSEVESTSSLHADMPIERILEAEKRVDCKIEQGNYEVNIFAPADEDIACRCVPRVGVFPPARKLSGSLDM